MNAPQQPDNAIFVIARAALPRQRAFTMIELVTVLVIIGVLAVYAVGKMDFGDAFAERALNDRLVAAMQFARKAAVASRRYVCVSISSNQATFTIDNGQPDGLAPFSASCESNLNLPAADQECAGAANQVCAASGMTMAVSSGTSPFQFDPAGRTQGAVALSLSGGYQVTIEAETGYVH